MLAILTLYMFKVIITQYDVVIGSPDSTIKEFSMLRKLRVTAVLAVTIGILCGLPAMAQQSITNEKTAGVFKTDVDKYMNVTDYGSVGFEKSFGFVCLENGFLNLGYAKNFGGLYLGTYYYGLILQQPTATITDTVTTTPTVVNNTIVSTKTETEKEVTFDSGFTTENNAAVLLGIAGMGIKLGVAEYITTYVKPNSRATGATYSTNVLSSVTTDTADDSVIKEEYTNTSKVSGFLWPYLSWGMNIPLGGMTVKARAGAALTYSLDSETYTFDKTKTVARATPIGFTAVHEEYNKNNSYFTPSIGISAALESNPRDGAQSKFGVSYNFGMGLYGDGLKTQTKTTETTLNPTNKVTKVTDEIETDSESSMTNWIIPSYSYTKDLGEKFSVGLQTSVDCNISFVKWAPKTVTTTVTTTDDYGSNLALDTVKTEVETIPGDTTETTITTVSPAAGLGFIYRVVPGKFALMAGYNITLPEYTGKVTVTTRTETYSKTSTTVDGNGVTTNSTASASGGTSVDIEDQRTERQSSETTWNPLSGELRFGLTFNFTENFAMEAGTNLGQTGMVDLFGGGGNSLLANDYSLMFTLKY